jgi:prophage antirepressor-like protein
LIDNQDNEIGKKNMTKKESLQLFEEKKVRTVWDDKEEKWYFSIVDVCGVLTDSKDANAYWRKLKQRLKKEGNETVTNCHGLKLRASDGKLRITDVAEFLIFVDFVLFG